MQIRAAGTAWPQRVGALVATLVLAGCAASAPTAGASPGGAVFGSSAPPAAGAGSPRATPGSGGSTSHVPGQTDPGTVPPVVSHGRRDRPSVALTFDSNLTDHMIKELDSGAVPSFYNAAVVDELERYRVPTTFFLTGKWMERYPDATRRLAGNPLFELGSHSYAHRAFHLPCYGLARQRTDEMAADVARSFDILSRFTDHPTRYFRFPGDCYDAVALRAIAPVGCTVIHFDVASGDAFGTDVAAIVRHTLLRVRNGSIVVMHITGGNTAPLTAEALPRIIEGLRGKGFQLVRVSTLLGQGAP